MRHATSVAVALALGLGLATAAEANGIQQNTMAPQRAQVATASESGTAATAQRRTIRKARMVRANQRLNRHAMLQTRMSNHSRLAAAKLQKQQVMRTAKLNHRALKHQTTGFGSSKPNNGPAIPPMTQSPGAGDNTNMQNNTQNQ